MNIYDTFMYPLEKGFLRQMRKHLIPKAKGDVLELGAGTGANLAYFKSDNISSFTVLDKEISDALRKKASDNTVFVETSADNLPFDDNSFDTVVETLLLCSTDDVEKVLSEVSRVLKKDGVFIHIDHQMPHSSGLRKTFSIIAPLWHRMTRSCRIDKEFAPLFDKMNFKEENQINTGNGVFYGGIAKV